jgi:hypothetical protein
MSIFLGRRGVKAIDDLAYLDHGATSERRCKQLIVRTV